MATTATPQVEQTTDPHILVVDDDPCAADVASTILRRAGFDVVLVGDGESALKVVHEIPPRLILLDLHLPGIDGCEVCRRLKADEVTHHIPVVVISADRTRESVLRALEAGADDFLVKPIDPGILTHKIGSFPTPQASNMDSLTDDSDRDTDNRRRFVRFHLEAEAVLHLDLYILDISEGGVGFLANTPVLPGSILQVKCTLFEEILGVPNAQVQVKYCRLPHSRTKYRLGGEFIGLGEAEKKKIRQYVYRRQLARARPRENQD
jgi:CheY-like chemotaxis protein